MFPALQLLLATDWFSPLSAGPPGLSWCRPNSLLDEPPVAPHLLWRAHTFHCPLLGNSLTLCILCFYFFTSSLSIFKIERKHCCFRLGLKKCCALLVPPPLQIPLGKECLWTWGPCRAERRKAEPSRVVAVPCYYTSCDILTCLHTLDRVGAVQAFMQNNGPRVPSRWSKL